MLIEQHWLGRCTTISSLKATCGVPNCRITGCGARGRGSMP